MNFILCGWFPLADAATSDWLFQLVSVPLLIFIVFTIRNLVLNFWEVDDMINHQVDLIEQIKQQSRLVQRKLEIFKLSTDNRRAVTSKSKDRQW